MNSLPELIDKIAERTNLSKEDIEKKIEEKLVELSYLVSKEGAAYIVAKELGIDLLEKKDRSLKIKNIIPGMSRVDIDGKILKISDVKEFEREGGMGKVVSFLLGDETGSVRVVCWDANISKLSGLKEGDSVRITNAYSRTNIFGNVEVHLGENSSIEKIEKAIEVPENLAREGLSSGPKRKRLDKVKEGEFIETKATIVSILENKFYSCPECNSRVEKISEDFFCKDHGKVKPVENLMISGYMDDGFGAVRYLAFREIAEKILSMNPLGRELIFVGRVRKNRLYGNLEINIKDVFPLNIEEEIKKLCG